MKYLSLFTGIGGFELGIQQAYEQKNKGLANKGRPLDTISRRQKKKHCAGVGDTYANRSSNGTDQSIPICVGYSEIDRYAIQIYQKHFPNHKNYGDITTLDPETLPDFDFLCGGFPCQAFSIAGKRRGFDDTRGTLFFNIANILRSKKPRLLLLENVKGLLSHDDGRTFKTIIIALDDLGYDLQWQVLNSKNHGVPQNRERIFIIGNLRGTPQPEVFPFGEISGLSPESSGQREASGEIATAITSNLKRGVHSGGETYAIGTLRTHKDGQGFREVKSGLAPTIPARAREDGSGQPVIMARNQRGEIREMPISGSLTKSKSGKQFSYLKIPEATRKGYAEATVGQSINLAVMGSKTRRGRVSDVAQTLDTGMQQHTLSPDMRIRRLTPIECERLQGFPDDWTRYGIKDGFPLLKVPVEISDTQRYKCLGNAVTTSVIRDIVARLIQ